MLVFIINTSLPTQKFNHFTPRYPCTTIITVISEQPILPFLLCAPTLSFPKQLYFFSSGLSDCHNTPSLFYFSEYYIGKIRPAKRICKISSFIFYL